MEQDAQGMARSEGRSQRRGPSRMATRLTCRCRARYRASSRHSLNRESLSLRWIQVAVYMCTRAGTHRSNSALPDATVRAHALALREQYQGSR